GDFVELGCYTGSTATVFAQLLQAYDPSRFLHVFDRFDIELGRKRSIRNLFVANLERFEVAMPVIHEGDFIDTVPGELPERIAFVHIDCGHGGDVKQHAALVTHCLNGIYPRLSPGAVVVFMDYHVPGVTWYGNDSNPGVRLACDAFFADKPENIHLLYGGACSHACIRKV
ncbi:MAG TPA: class I SAM-dependent methyltransferase, partial [Flavobacteriales bacterium]|nr:class I SAM-dependent methyltransferase [Flavobacteriales bacterium]